VDDDKPLPPSERSKRADPVDRMVADSTPSEFVAWMVKYHGLPDKPWTRETVESNLAEQFRWHRLRGRLDRHPWLAALVELWLRWKGAR
jgi:hypothetical protein